MAYFLILSLVAKVNSLHTSKRGIFHPLGVDHNHGLFPHSGCLFPSRLWWQNRAMAAAITITAICKIDTVDSYSVFGYVTNSWKYSKFSFFFFFKQL